MPEFVMPSVKPKIDAKLTHYSKISEQTKKYVKGTYLISCKDGTIKIFSCGLKEHFFLFVRCCKQNARKQTSKQINQILRNICPVPSWKSISETERHRRHGPTEVGTYYLRCWSAGICRQQRSMVGILFFASLLFRSLDKFGQIGGLFQSKFRNRRIVKITVIVFFWYIQSQRES